MISPHRNVQQVLERLPHRYPFLMIDRILNIDESNKSVSAIKNVTMNEHFFIGHFPGRPIMPGVLIVEALAQAAVFLTPDIDYSNHDGGNLRSSKQYFLASVRDARFKRPVVPGDQLILEVKLTNAKKNIFCFSGKATVEGQLVASVDFVCAVKEHSIE